MTYCIATRRSSLFLSHSLALSLSIYLSISLSLFLFFKLSLSLSEHPCLCKRLSPVSCDDIMAGVGLLIVLMLCCDAGVLNEVYFKGHPCRQTVFGCIPCLCRRTGASANTDPNRRTLLNIIQSNSGGTLPRSCPPTSSCSNYLGMRELLPL